MKIIEYTESFTTQTHFPEYYKYFYPDAKPLFFDIETTGFSAKNTTLYLIGALWYEAEKIHIIQWFNDDGKSETEILNAFHTFCKTYTHLIHFNGVGFDLSYLKQKAALLHIPFTVDTDLEQIDIYKEIRSYKNIFQLDNMKQVSIEHYLDICRKDTYSGKELIHMYQRFVSSPNMELEQLLLLHNHDDLLGMPQISTILNYKAFFEHPNITNNSIKIENNKLLVYFNYPDCFSLPKRISATSGGIYLNAIHTEALLQIPVLEDTLKHYFKDYKNYYYLPQEDMAIHKSVAAYVDSQNKEKATKSTCYIKKRDYFILCPDSDFSEQFKREYSDQITYQTIQSILLTETSVNPGYIIQLLHTFL